MRIELLIGIGDYVLAVYYTSSRCYQAAILTASDRASTSASIYLPPGSSGRGGRKKVDLDVISAIKVRS